MKMAKLSEAQVKALRAVRDNKVEPINKRTLDALRCMFAIKQDAGNGAARLAAYFSLTPTGRTLLKRAERVKQEQAERASRPVPASAFVEPSARTAPVLGLEYEDEPEEETEQTSGPSVRLTPAPAGVEQEATDAEILQLLAMLDAGVKVSRSLYQEYMVTGMGSWTLNLDAVNRAARDAVRFGLATQEFRERLYRISAEPIHLDTGTGLTGCGIAQSYSKQRRRWTTDPAKVTHERCKPEPGPLAVGDVVRFKQEDSPSRYRVTEVAGPDVHLDRITPDVPGRQEIAGGWRKAKYLERASE